MGKEAAGATGGGLAGFMGAANPYIGIAMSGLNIGMNLAEASKQKELQRAADRAAEKSAAEQERLLSQDFYQGLQVPMEVYDREFAANTASEKQGLEALVEGDQRLVLGGVGKSQAVTVGRNAQTADRAADKLYNLAMTQAGAAERANLRLAPLEAKRLEGAQEASAAAQMAKIQAQQRAIEAAGGGLLKDLGNMIPEYSKTQGSAAGPMTGTGSSIFNGLMSNQSSGFSLPSAPMAPVGFGQSMFQSNPFAAVSMPSGLEYSFNPMQF
jgi:hypothetical protein